MDDLPKTWDFQQFEKAVNDMPAETASVGSILSAMVFQIEQANDETRSAHPQFSLDKQMDKMFEEVAFGSGCRQTDFKKQFKAQNYLEKSPYQTVLQRDDDISLRSE